MTQDQIAQVFAHRQAIEDNYKQVVKLQTTNHQLARELKEFTKDCDHERNNCGDYSPTLTFDGAKVICTTCQAIFYRCAATR